GVPIDGRARTGEREIAPGGPERQQIAVVRAGGLARLARHVDGERIVPVAQIKYLAEGCAVRLAKVRAAGGHDRIGIAAARDGRWVEDGAACLVGRECVTKIGLVQIAPAPA